MTDSNSIKFTMRARQLVKNGSFAKAYDTYVAAFEKHPNLKNRLQKEFILLLSKLNEVLLKTNKVGDIFYNFERAIDAFPGNMYILNDIGKYLYKFGYYKEACCHFQKALNADCGYVAAEKNLNSIKNFLVDRWHFRMLNDKVRNEAYRKAIRESITPLKETILDIGTGVGLLTAYAWECQPMAMTAIEASETMTDVAESVFYENEITPVLLVSKMSTKLDYRDIGGKRSLILIEMFDAGLFGEQVLQTLVHSWENFTSIVGRVLPQSAEFFVVGANSDCLNMRYQLSESAKKILNILNLNVQISTDDPYDSEDVAVIKDLKYITEPASVFKVDFNSVEDINKKLNKNDPYDVNLKAKDSGNINVIIGWFNLHLTDEVMLTTNPASNERANAWQQAIFTDYIPKMVKKNQNLSMQFTSFGGKLALIPDMVDTVRISEEMVRFLNDSTYMKMMTGLVGTVCIHLIQTTVISQLHLVDLCPFPVLGLLMMKRGSHSLICYAKNREDRKFIKKVFKMNKISSSKLTILVGDELELNFFYEKKFHMICSNTLELCGDIDCNMKEMVDGLREHHLLVGGLVIPHEVQLVAQLVNSNWLNINNRLYDENVHNYKVAMFLNKYQVTQNFHLDLEHLEYEAISEPTSVAVVTEPMRGGVVNVPIIKIGQANAIICWYTIQFIQEGETVSTNRANSFAEGIAFLLNPAISMTTEKKGNILKCVDENGAFKLVIDSENRVR